MSVSMDPERQGALRKPFPRSAVGQLPKGGVMLDYVGHAATTDRLLSVDPEWTWEPMATDEYGNPRPDEAGNLWIRLTVCGVTRIGVGDGKNMKERIGDALRNAAMRFGVALDLWSKEELEGAHGEAEKPDRKAERVRAPQEDAWTVPPDSERPTLPMADKTRARMFALFGDLGIDDPDRQRAGIAQIIGHEIASRADLAEGEAQKVIADLAPRVAARKKEKADA